MPNDQTPGQRDAASSLPGAIGRVTSILAIPYGYTVTLGASALLSVARLGAPSEVEVLWFVAGAVLSFVFLAGIGSGVERPGFPLPEPRSCKGEGKGVFGAVKIGSPLP